MHSFVEQLPDAVLVAEDGVVRFVNAAAVRLLAPGAQRALVGTALGALLCPGELERVETVLAQRERGFEALPDSFRLRFERADERKLTVDARFAVDGQSLIFVLRDATESERAEALMARLANLSRNGKALTGAEALLDAAEPVFVELGWRGAWTRVLPDGSTTLRALACPPDDAVGDYARSLVGRFLPRSATPVVHQVATERRAFFFDNAPEFLRGKVSEAKRLSASLTESHLYRTAWLPVRDAAGDITHILSVAGANMSERDFVALQLFAAQLGEANELARMRAELVKRERLAAVGEMAAVLAHEIRNPLGVVFNAANGLRRTVTGEVNLSLLDSLLEEAERLRLLTGDLLDFARPSAPQPTAVDLGHLLRDVCAVSAGENRRRARVEVEVPDDLPRVAADPAMLRRALLNLCINALQHVTVGGLVRLEASADAAAVTVRVENEGETISPELVERIFEPFFTTRATGAGLGLAVVRRLVSEQGGLVSLEPRAKGVTFVVTLPLAAIALDEGAAAP